MKTIVIGIRSQSTILLFKVGRIKEARNKAFWTFCGNPYWIDNFLGRPLESLDIWHLSNLTTVEYTENLAYSGEQPELPDFSAWLSDLTTTEAFTRRCNQYIDIYRQLMTETDKELRRRLVQDGFQLEHSG